MEIVDCLQKIKEECNKIWNSNTIFDFDINNPLRLQEFKSKQKDNIINLNVAPNEIYEYLKISEYMTMVYF